MKELLQTFLSILAGFIPAFIINNIFETKIAAIAVGLACSYLAWGELGDLLGKKAPPKIVDQFNEDALKIKSSIEKLDQIINTIS